jgi:hypothetical protein
VSFWYSTGTAEGPGAAVFIVTAGFQDGGTYVLDARSVTVTFK